MLTSEDFFSECQVIMAASMVVRLVIVVFIILVFVRSSLLLRMASICLILHHLELQLQRLSFPHHLLFKKVFLNTSVAIYHFRVKND